MYDLILHWDRPGAPGDHRTPNIQGATPWTDNHGLVNRLNQQYPLDPLKAEWDLVEPTRILLQKNAMTIAWVRGHQTITPTSPREVRMNDRADQLATGAHSKPRTRGVTPKGYKINLYIGQNKITTKFNREIRHAGNSPPIRNYYHERHGWSDATMHAIDWDAHGKAIRSFSREKKDPSSIYA